MKKGSLSVRMLVLLSLLAFTAACGGGGGGGGASAPAKGTFTKEPFKATSTGSWSGVFDSGMATMRVQNLYTGTTGSNRLTGSGYITKIGFRAFSAVSSSFTCTGVTIKMGNTSLASLTTTYANNVEQGKGSLATVVQDKTVTIPVLSAGDYITIDLTTPFYYNGVDNLVVDYIRAGTCTGAVNLMYDDTVPSGQAVESISIVSATGFLDKTINTKFTFAGGENKQEYGGTNNNTWPFSANGSPGSGAPLRTQNLYLASNIQGSGPVTGIGFQMNATSVQGTYTYSLTLGHSILTALTPTFASNYSDSPVRVANAVSFTIPAGIPAGEWIWVPIPGSVFTYNGVDNLIVSVATTSGTANNTLRTTLIAGSRVWGDSDTAATGTVDSSEYNVALRFNGGKMMVLPNAPEGGSGQVLGVGAAGQIQSVYKNTMLGTSGTINNVYVRLRSTATPTSASLTNYKLYMGHTTKSALSLADTYASNMDGMATVFNGTLTVPAGVTAGDWVKIPLSQAFLYDSSKNLSILFATDAGPSGNTVSTHFDVTLFPSNTVGRNDNSVTPSGLPTWDYHGIVDLAVDISK